MVELASRSNIQGTVATCLSFARQCQSYFKLPLLIQNKSHLFKEERENIDMVDLPVIAKKHNDTELAYQCIDL